MFPGENYEFLEAFLKHNVVFLDLPSIDLPEGIITTDSPHLKARLIASHAIGVWLAKYRSWARSSQSEAAPVRPSNDFLSYASSAWFRGHTTVLGATIAFFGAAQKGDLVVIPSKIPQRQIFIGEFTDGPEHRILTTSANYGMDVTTLARRINWFPPVDELTVPSRVSDVLRIPVAFSLLANNLYDSIFEKSYGTFYKDNEYAARIYVRGQDFDAQNTFDLGALAKLAAFVAANVGRHDFESELSTYIESIAPSEFQPTLSLNINSPGLGVLRASTLTPFIFTAIFSLLSATNAAEAPTKPTSSEVAVINSAAASDPECVAEVAKSVETTLNFIGYDQWETLCRRQKRLESGPRIGVDSQAKASK